jgi:NAD-dependent dihydropyrimidine dehydrogenase PreA subunit/DNA-binding transcriptional ArsR family regulator
VSQIDPVYQELAAKMKRPNSKVLPALLQRLADLEQARIVRELPAQPEEIAKKLGLDRETVEKHLSLLFEKGLVTRGKRSWNLASSWGWLHDAIGSSDSKYDDIELFDVAMVMSGEELMNLSQRVEKGDKRTIRQYMRVIPKWKTIKDIPGVLPCEDVREVFRNSPPIVLINCACRRLYKDRKCKTTLPVNVCLSCGRLGRHVLSRGIGKELTYDELIKFLDRLDEYQLVNLTGNSNRMPIQMCNCHNCCCGMFHIRAYTKPNMNQSPFAKSRFIVEDHPEKCIACGKCINERCPIGAISMKYFPEFGGERSYTDTEECIGCGLCVLTCPAEARKMKLVRPPEHIPEPSALPSIADAEIGDLL